MSDSVAPDREELCGELIKDFLDESDELLGGLNENLLRLDEWVQGLTEGQDEVCDPELLNEIFRAAHSFKGLSAMLGLDDINRLTHVLENVFDAARNHELSITSDVVELTFKAVDCLVGMVNVLKDPGADPVESDAVVAEIDHLLKTHQQSDQSPEVATEPSSAAAVVEPVAGEIDAPSPVPESQTRERDPFAGIEDDPDISGKYLSIFIDETDQSLEELTEALLTAGDEPRIDTLLCICHRIKGGAASVGLNRPARMSHVMEDLLQQLQEQGEPLTAEAIDALIAGTDALKDYLRHLAQGTGENGGLADAYRTVAAVGQEMATLPLGPSSEPAEADESPVNLPSTGALQAGDFPLAEILDDVPKGGSVALGRVIFQQELLLAGLKARLLHDRLMSYGKVLYCDPPAEKLDELDELFELKFAITTETAPEDLAASIDVEGVRQVEVIPGNGSPSVDVQAPTASGAGNGPEEVGGSQSPPEASNPRPAPSQAAPTKTASPTPESPNTDKRGTPEAKTRPAETLRVDIERLDQLMNLAGQLVMNKARFLQIGEGLKQFMGTKQAAHSLDNALAMLEHFHADRETSEYRGLDKGQHERMHAHAQRMRNHLEVVQREIDHFATARSFINDLSEAVHQLDRVADGIQKSVMDTRMVPIGPLFNRFRRVVRDITRGNKKDINLVIHGEHTELDKRMIDELGDPLIHMVRNSADHGIELPEVRLAAGKPACGTVTLNAFHRGNSIVIQVTDDGKGLDHEKLRAKAVEKGILPASEAERLTPQQAFQLIWEPGFSTAEKVTEVSGRGMGMDIVRTKIEELSGSIELDSVLGKGTTITIKLPLTLAILPSLLSEIEGDVFAIPVESIVEIVRLKDEDLATVHGLRTARVRGRIISVVELSQLFEWNVAPRTTESSTKEQSLVIVGVEGQLAGLIVHRLIGEEDIVIKSIAENYRHIQGIAGASILGDGRVSLILDVAAMVEMAACPATPESTRSAT